MVVPSEPPAASLILIQLKQEVAELKASYKLASQPSTSSAPSLQGLEREAQLARRQYDALLQQRRKQTAELEKIIASWQQLQAGAAAQQQDAPAQRRAQHLQAQLAIASAHLAEALDTQQQYADVIQQLKQGHAEFEWQLEQLRVELAGQQQLKTKAKAHLLQAQHSRDTARRELSAAEQQLQTGRASRAGLLQQLSVQCQTLMQAPPVASSSNSSNSSSSSSRRHINKHACNTNNTSTAVGPEDEELAEQMGLQDCFESLSIADCLRQLLHLTGCCDEQGLLLHVRAHVKAAASLQEAAGAAQAKLEQLAT